MIKKPIVLCLIPFMFAVVSFAQQSAVYTNDFVDYQKALQLYNNYQYLASQSAFRTLKKHTNEDNVKSDCTYYIANCAVRLNQQNADDLVVSFIETYPTSTKKNTALVDIADYYFENEKFERAQKWYQKVEAEALSRKEREKFNFNAGYTAFYSKKYKLAKRYLNRVENSSEYGSQAKYYIGFMAYKGDDYDKANTYFAQVNDQEKYKEKLSYYQADLNFKLGEFEKAIALAKTKIPSSDAHEVSELSKIIGESYFNLEKYVEAIPYLTAYKGKNGKWNNTDYYQLGYAHYKQKEYDKAISEFNKIIDGKNDVAQNAYYHLGESYVSLNKKQEALNAFRNASQMDFDLKIKEDAWLNYAKISYEIGNPYQSVPHVLDGYLKHYPETIYKEEIEALLIDSYITSKNYKEALILLKEKKTEAKKTAYQKVAYYRGVELFNENNYTAARALFENSLSEPKNEKYVARATFWKAESNYNLTNYDAALSDFKNFKTLVEATNTTEFETIDYNLAYAYFKKKDYMQAIQYFKQFINKQSTDKLKLNDAYLRLADGFFVTSQYSKAIVAYEQAIKIGEIEVDYATFQKAMSTGYLGNASKKILELEQFVSKYPKSKLRDDALYTLGNAYVKSGSTQLALATYNRLISNYGESKFTSKALLRQGLVYYNNNNNQDALIKFKKVARDYPSSLESSQAIATARLIYIDLGQVDQYATWVKTLDYVEVTDADLDRATYASAEKQYLDGNTNAAIRLFNTYLNDFRTGLYKNQSHFYLAQLYFKKDEKLKAKPNYKAVTEAFQSEFTEEALLRLSQIILEQKLWSEAIPTLKRLETEANFPQNSLFARSNLMQAYYQIKEYATAVIYAEKVLQKSNLDNKVKSDAYIIIARSAIKTGDEAKAKDAFAKVELTAKGVTAAEALYYNAYFKYKEGRYQNSLKTTQRLVKAYSSYRYFGAKGLIIMAKNQYALNDAFQATYILENIPKNFSEFDDVVAEAAEELNKIKIEQAKTNASVAPKN